MPSLFLGVTTSPAREFIASCILERKPARAFMPCAGRFATIEALVGSGLDRSKVIASDIGGMTERIRDGVNGFLCEPEDATALARLIRSLDSADLHGIGERARESVADLKSEPYAEALERIYTDIIRGKRDIGKDMKIA